MSTEVLSQAIDPASDRAVYKQIADHLREAIGRGRLKEGDQLTSEAQLIGHCGVARMTIRSALRLLEAEGLITAEHGRGVYVRARPPVRRLASDRFAQRHRKKGKAALHFAALFDRLIQNLRRFLGYDVQYFAAVEPQRRLAPHIHIAIRGTVSRGRATPGPRRHLSPGVVAGHVHGPLPGRRAARLA